MIPDRVFFKVLPLLREPGSSATPGTSLSGKTFGAPLLERWRKEALFLDILLVLDGLLDDSQRGPARDGEKIAVAPETRQAGAAPAKRLVQQPLDRPLTSLTR
jgi:hypothetical protein